MFKIGDKIKMKETGVDGVVRGVKEEMIATPANEISTAIYYLIELSGNIYKQWFPESYITSGENGVTLTNEQELNKLLIDISLDNRYISEETRNKILRGLLQYQDN